MNKTTLIFLLLAVISMMLIAGCTQPVVTKPTPASTPAVTVVPTYVQNQGGVAIIKTVNVTATPTVVPTVAVQVNQTVAVKTNTS